MTDHDFWASLRTDTTRYQDWMAVFGEDAVLSSGSVQVPITTPIPERVILPIGERHVYFLKLAVLTDAQRDRLKTHLCNRFGVARAELEAEFARTPGHEVPIVAEDLMIAVYHPQKWLA